MYGIEKLVTDSKRTQTIALLVRDVATGALQDVDAAFAMHVMPHLPSGSIHTRGGTIMAGALSFRVIVAGRGGHAAMPHLNVDPVVAAAGLISALQVSEDLLRPWVLTTRACVA